MCRWQCGHREASGAADEGGDVDDCGGNTAAAIGMAHCCASATGNSDEVRIEFGGDFGGDDADEGKLSTSSSSATMSSTIGTSGSIVVVVVVVAVVVVVVGGVVVDSWLCETVECAWLARAMSLSTLRLEIVAGGEGGGEDAAAAAAAVTATVLPLEGGVAGAYERGVTGWQTTGLGARSAGGNTIDES